MKTLSLSALVVALAVAVPSSALAQARESRPYRGLFGGGYGDADQMLAVNASFGAGYDGNILLGQNGAVGTPSVTSGATASTVTNASAGLAYNMFRKKTSLSLFGNASAVYYPSLPNPLYRSYGAGGGGSFQLTTRTSLSVSFGVSWAPLTFLPSLPVFSDQSALAIDKAFLSKLNRAFVEQFGVPAAIDLTPTTATVPDENSGDQFQNHTSVTGSVGLSHQLTRKVTVSASASALSSESAGGVNTISSRSGAGSISYALAKGLSLRAGYGESEGRFGSGPSATVFRGHSIDGGIDFDRALSVSRRVKVSFGTGSSALSDGIVTRYYFTGHADVHREIGRSWDASLAYNRSIGFLEAFRQPVISDTLGAGLSGLLSRAVQFHASAGLSRGVVGLVSANNGYTAYFAGTGVNFALARSWSLGVSYSYYRYSFDGGVILPIGVPAFTNRQSIMASVNLWQPIFTRSRRPNASR